MRPTDVLEFCYTLPCFTSNEYTCCRLRSSWSSQWSGTSFQIGAEVTCPKQANARGHEATERQALGSEFALSLAVSRVVPR